MKTITAILTLTLISCGGANPPSATNPTTPGPNTALVVAAASMEAACEIGATLVSPSAAAWLTGPCPTAAAGILNIVDTNGTAAQIQAAITTLQATYAAIPAGTLTANDQKYIVAAIAAAQLTLSIYEAETGQTVTAETPACYQDGCNVFVLASFQQPAPKPAPHKLALTKQEHERLQALKKRAEDLKKKAKK